MSNPRKNPKFVLDDFKVPGNTPIQNLENLMSKLEIVTGNEAVLSGRDIRILLAAKNRRHSDYFHGIYIFGRIENDFKGGKSQKLVDVAKDIYEGKIPRTQIIYHSNFKNHYFGFDIQLNSNKSLSIFTIDSSSDNCQSKVIDALTWALSKLNIPHTNYGCRAAFQSDGINCAVYMYAILSELAKHVNFHEDLKTSPQVSEPPAHSDCTPYVTIGRVKWISHSVMPLKIITMTQSYTRMLRFLLDREMTKEEAEKTASACKNKCEKTGKNFDYINDRNQKDYINNCKQKIAKRLDGQLLGFYGGFSNPIFSILSNRMQGGSSGINVKYILESVKPLEFNEKIRFILGAVESYFKTVKFNSGVLAKYTTIADLRDVLIDILKNDKRPNGSMQLLQKNILIDGPFDFMLEFDAEDKEETARYRKLIDGLVKNPADEALVMQYSRERKIRDDLIEKYTLDRYDVLRKTACYFYVAGESHKIKIAKLITKLSDEQLAQLFEKFPNKNSLANLKNIASHLKTALFGAGDNDLEDVKIIREVIAPLKIGKPVAKK